MAFIAFSVEYEGDITHKGFGNKIYLLQMWFTEYRHPYTPYTIQLLVWQKQKEQHWVQDTQCHIYLQTFVVTVVVCNIDMALEMIVSVFQNDASNSLSQSLLG